MNKYQRAICYYDDAGNRRDHYIDVYDILEAFGVTCPAVQHAIKKLLMPGQRGHKSRKQDLKEAMQSIERAIELEHDRTPTEQKQ